MEDSVSRILGDLLEKLFQSICFCREPLAVVLLGSESRVEVDLVQTLDTMGVWKDDWISDQGMNPPRLG